jgi:hypothetical protein
MRAIGALPKPRVTVAMSMLVRHGAPSAAIDPNPQQPLSSCCASVCIGRCSRFDFCGHAAAL